MATDGDELDGDFLVRLHNLLDLTDKNGLHVILDNHGDMVGTLGCGNGVPAWIQQLAVPELVGKPLETGFPYNFVDQINVKKTAGYEHCGSNATMWAEHAGDPNYNLLNECCLAMNSGNPGGLGYTKINQKTMDYVMNDGPGQDAFIKFWKLMAEAVVDHPSAIGLELMNEPMSIYRKQMFSTWVKVAKVVVNIIPDIAVSLSDTGQEPIVPEWMMKLAGSGFRVSSADEKYIKESNNMFYAFHRYQLTLDQMVDRVTEIKKDWDVPVFCTEGGDCDLWDRFRQEGISRSYWHYSCYCDTGGAFGDKMVPKETFGGCMLGWGSGDSSKFYDEKCMQ